jgi:hypothetical protein
MVNAHPVDGGESPGPTIEVKTTNLQTFAVFVKMFFLQQ